MARNIRLAMAPLGALIAVSLAAALPAPANAAGYSGKSVQATDFSARRHHHHYHHYSYAPWRLGWHRGHVANPNYGPGTRQLRQAQREGRCVIDEGYGRSFACSNN